MADHLGRAAALCDIALQPPLKADLVGSVDVDAQLVEGQQFGEMEGEDALDEQIGAGADGLSKGDSVGVEDAGIRGEVVERALDGFTPGQRGNVGCQEGNLDQRGVVEVLAGALFQRQVGQIAIVRVGMEVDAAVVLPEPVQPAIPTTTGGKGRRALCPASWFMVVELLSPVWPRRFWARAA